MLFAAIPARLAADFASLRAAKALKIAPIFDLGFVSHETLTLKFIRQKSNLFLPNFH